jgi:hypothetical protein
MPIADTVGPGTGTAESMEEATVEPASTVSAPSTAIARAMAAGTAAGLMPFELPHDASMPDLLTLGPTPATIVDRIKRGPAGGREKPSPAGDGGGSQPESPAGPPGSTSAAGAGAASGGASTGLWCAVLVGLLSLAYRELRRYRVRPVLAGPVGVVSLLQRPG